MDRGLLGGSCAKSGQSLFPERPFALAPRHRYLPARGDNLEAATEHRTPGQLPGLLVVWAWVVFLHRQCRFPSSQPLIDGTRPSRQCWCAVNTVWIRTEYTYSVSVPFHHPNHIPVPRVVPRADETIRCFSLLFSPPWSPALELPVGLLTLGASSSCLARVARVRLDSVRGPQRSCPRRLRQGTSPMVPIARFNRSKQQGAARSSVEHRPHPV